MLVNQGLELYLLMQEGKPIAFASRSLTTTQQRYAPIEQELLAVVFGCERFHKYIYGKQVKVFSNHKPLERIFKNALQNTPHRLQRMLLSLQKYDIELSYLSGKENIVADTLSRAHLLEDYYEEIGDKDLVAQVHMAYDNTAVIEDKIEEIKRKTLEDLTMMLLSRFISNGWPTHKKDVPEEVKVFWSYREELSLINGIVFKGKRIVVPESVRKNILQQLHQSHMGAERTKLKARSTIF